MLSMRWRRLGSMTDAARCRRNGWKVGDRLIGIGPSNISVTILLTAIGEKFILARSLVFDGVKANSGEGLRSLLGRKWRKAK